MYNPNPRNTSTITLSPEIEQLSEKLSENVHEVWAQGRVVDGWKHGVKRDDTLKTHPNLVSYNELSEEDKNYDRNTAKETLKVMQKLGFEIKKTSPYKGEKAILLCCVVFQVVMFIAWLVVTIWCSKIEMYSHIIFLLLSIFITAVIVALAKSISKKESLWLGHEIYKDKELFMRKIGTVEELSKKTKDLKKELKELEELKAKQSK